MSNPYSDRIQQAYDNASAPPEPTPQEQAMAIFPRIQACGPQAVQHVLTWAAGNGITSEQIALWQSQVTSVTVKPHGLSHYTLYLDGRIELRSPYTNDMLPWMDDDTPEAFLNNAVQVLAESLSRTLHA